MEPAATRTGPATGRERTSRLSVSRFAVPCVAAAAAFAAAAAGAGAPWLLLPALTAGAGALWCVAELRALNRRLHAGARERAGWERRYRRLHDSVALGVFRADAAGRVVGANPGLVALLGFRSEAELLAGDFAEQIYVGPGTFEALLGRVRTQGALELADLRLRRADGLTATVLATVEAVWDEAGGVESFEAVLVDVTRERLATSQRRTLERRFRRLFEAPGVGILLGSLPRGAVEEANSTLIEQLGLRPSELPVPLERLIPDEERALHRELRAALELEGSAGPVPASLRRSDGTRLDALLSVALLDPATGEFIAVVIDRARAVGDNLRTPGRPAAAEAASPPVVDGVGRRSA
ncbi:MAG: PAS domain-containing protein [Proteobacteria bacterium]|nr:PAS domain-containing protein [Pseudomonadota bacterium]